MQEASSHQRGKIITFYSYKGGTGRSMALANVARLLSKRLGESRRILAMDWDLEAPGLHRFFATKAELPDYELCGGVMDYFQGLEALLRSSDPLYEQLKAPQGWTTLEDRLPLSDYIIPDVVSNVDLMRAGRLDDEYARLVGSFD